MNDHVVILEQWRQQAHLRRLSVALWAVAFPIPVVDAIEGAGAPDPVLITWAREGLASERIFRSAQAELLAAGHSLTSISATTGVPVLEPFPRPGDVTCDVLGILGWAGWEEDQ